MGPFPLIVSTRTMRISPAPPSSPHAGVEWKAEACPGQRRRGRTAPRRSAISTSISTGCAGATELSAPSALDGWSSPGSPSTSATTPPPPPRPSSTVGSPPWTAGRSCAGRRSSSAPTTGGSRREASVRTTRPRCCRCRSAGGGCPGRSPRIGSSPPSSRRRRGSCRGCCSPDGAACAHTRSRPCGRTTSPPTATARSGSGSSGRVTPSAMCQSRIGCGRPSNRGCPTGSHPAGGGSTSRRAGR